MNRYSLKFSTFWLYSVNRKAAMPISLRRPLKVMSTKTKISQKLAPNCNMLGADNDNFNKKASIR